MLSPQFIPGEEELRGMTKQLEAMGVKVDHRKIYKADGVVRLADDLEVLLVETAGPFQADNQTKLAFDNSKGMFGLLSMMKTIADKYRYSSKEKFKQLKLLFLQPGNCTLRLWTIKYDKNGYYQFERVAKVVISQEFEKKDKCLLNLASFAIELKKHLLKTLETIKIIKDDHEEQQLEFDSDMDSQRLCLSDIICPKIFKISYNHHSKGFSGQGLESPEDDS